MYSLPELIMSPRSENLFYFLKFVLKTLESKTKPRGESVLRVLLFFSPQRRQPLIYLSPYIVDILYLSLYIVDIKWPTNKYDVFLFSSTSKYTRRNRKNDPHYVLCSSIHSFVPQHLRNKDHPTIFELHTDWFQVPVLSPMRSAQELQPGSVTYSGTRVRRLLLTDCLTIIHRMRRPFFFLLPRFLHDPSRLTLG
jgi:hypothetical protein